MPANKVAVVIPARHGSTRFPGKPLCQIAGKPLIQHVWERCGKARGITAVIVATDDMRIAEAAFAFGAEVSMTAVMPRALPQRSQACWMSGFPAMRKSGLPGKRVEP